MSRYKVTIPIEVSFDTYNTNRKAIEQSVYNQRQEFLNMLQQAINEELEWYHDQVDDYFCPDDAYNIGLAGYERQSTEIVSDNKHIKFERIKDE